MNFELLFVLAETEWCITMQNLIYKDAVSPDVSFWAVDILDESFGTHVYRATDIYVFPPLLGAFGKPKVGNLSHTFIKQNIGNLEVSVYDTLFIKVL